MKCWQRTQKVNMRGTTVITSWLAHSSDLRCKQHNTNHHIFHSPIVYYYNRIDNAHHFVDKGWDCNVHMMSCRSKISLFDSITARIYTLFCFHLWRHSPCFDAVLEVQSGDHSDWWFRIWSVLNKIRINRNM